MAKLNIWHIFITFLVIKISYLNGFQSKLRFKRENNFQQFAFSYQPQTKQQLSNEQFRNYLLRNNITLGLNSLIQQTGNWAEWSEPSECSRKCGGGVITQTRICLDNNCYGPSKKYFSCNIENCDPNEPDFREQQCSAYNNFLFKERYFEWVPYLQAQNPCELNCMPKGQRFYYKHKDKVIDGTKCYNDGSLDVCVDGQCMPVGCDNMLGSPRVEDKCGVCGGDGTTCHVLHGVYDNDNLKTGYNDLFTIPAGATNIKIEEIIPTTNYLAIKSTKGNYYLNGNWKIEFPRSMKFAGTVFNYVRKANAQYGAEYLTSTGPTNEPLIVDLLYQEKNRGIMYEYAVKKNDSSFFDINSNTNEVEQAPRLNFTTNYPFQQYHSQYQYHWWTGDWTPCNKKCSGGQQQRRVLCLKLKENNFSKNSSDLPANSEIFHEQYCESRFKPTLIQSCNTHICPPTWQAGHWSKCICDKNIKIRSVYCKKGAVHPETGRPIQDSWVITDDDECNISRSINRKPKTVKICEENEGCNDLNSINLSNSTDNQSLEEKKTDEIDDIIDELATIPPLRICETKYAYQWHSSNWTECDSNCGEGYKSRNVTCLEVDPSTGRIINQNNSLPEIYCRNSEKPDTKMVCNEVPCSGVDWIVSEWTSCSENDNEKKKTEDLNLNTNEAVDISPSEENSNINPKKYKFPSIQTRTVKCATKDGIIYADKLCGLKRKPSEKKVCEKIISQPSWFVSEWSECSTFKCGNGIKTRVVKCAIFETEAFKVFSDEECNLEKKPVVEEECSGLIKECENIIFATPWSGCENKCNEKRSLVCLSKNSTKNELKNTDCKDKVFNEILERNCENENSDSIDAQTQCNTDVQALNCTDTTYGCCPGSSEAAEGLNFKGCEVTFKDDCESSNFGCCQDGKSVAFGPFQFGCILNCNKTIHGCCYDKLTIALGSNYEGCAPLCQSTKFGCCENNSTAIDENKSNCLESEAIKNTETECEIYEDVIEGSGDDIEGSGNEIDDSKQKKKCRKKLEKSCLETEYGCCSDNITAALDDKKSNCVKEQLCNSSTFGCCLDNITVATGTNYEGCNLTMVKKESCEFSEFGCCPDSFTPARGADNFGCEGCAMHKFGCCSDGVTIATGKNQQGCGCTTTLHGCCLDGITPASGPSLEGCNDCKTSKYGCCQDGKTPARGLIENNQLDCPCESTEFGCCPDRITSSQGPDYSGCPCSSLLHGCCPDGITSASGPRFEGCDCQRSPHGCCSDGKTVAYGPRFLGCPDGPSLDVQFNGHACSLPKERGKCRNFTVKWFFDQTYGGCSRFWYGGCEGNGNQFISQDECERSCMKPIGSNSCQLPLVKGPCEQDKIYWGYNSQRHVCEEFTYGGCLGNNNRFESREMCEDTCFYLENNDPCEQPIKPGNCGGNNQRYYYNKIIHKCQPFVYTGCQGNNNNFGSELECKSRCEARTAREICVLPVSEGTCLGKYPRYYFDYNTGVCKEFMYTGCEGNNNRFVDKFSCERLCNTTLPYYKKDDSEPNRRPYLTPNRLLEEDKKKSDVAAVLATLQHICNNNKDPGNCEESTIKWWFNPAEKKCESFYWSGCGGNNNRFDSKNDCESRCISQLNGYIKLHQDLLLRQQMKILEEQKQLQRQKLLEQNVIRQNICLQPRETGNCYNFIERFYYDRDDKKCHRFYFSGCNGNDNNFESFEECTHRCGSPLLITNESNDKNLIQNVDQQNSTFKTEDCFLPSEHGPCDNDEPKWFYDSSDGICKQFYYGGCGGNNNRFENGRECQTKCWNSQNICILPKVKGPCNGNFSQWFYDKETSECKEFSYGGCQGNGNRFSSKEMCLEACSQNSQNNYQFNLIDHSHTNKKASDICHLKPEKGDGYQYLENYYYDPVQNICKMFIYSGSGGNKNRFENRLICESQCVDGHKLEVPEPTENDNKYEICLKPSEKGLCYQSMARWYYDPNSFTCLTFVYTGCGGNLNKFLTYDNCIKFCAGVKPKLDDESSFILPSTTTISPSTTRELTYSQPTPPPSPSFEERPPQPEDCPVEDCSQRCVFGIDNYVDNRGCRRCRCSHPCHIHNCPNGFRCAVEVYRTEQGQPLVQPVCRLLNKPGECPMPSVLNQLSGPFKDCQDRCRVDADCRGTDKCCNNGCANVCFNVQPSSQNKNDFEESDKVKVLAKLNDRVILNCGSLPAKTEVSVAWMKENKSVLQQLAAIENRLQILNNGSLLIDNLSVDDSGDYSCSYAKRETSELVTKVRELEVYQPVLILSGPKQVIATPNQYAILECNARGLPKPTVTWWKDKKMLPTSSNKYTQNLENYQLKINSVSNSDAGVYYCQAHNDHGPIKVWDVTLLLEFEPNLHTPNIQKFDQTNYTFDMNDNRIPSNKVYVSQGKIIEGVNNKDNYGNSRQKYQDPLQVETKLITQEYKTGSSLKIDCLVNQQANVTWYFNDEPIDRSNILLSLARRSYRYSTVHNSDNSITISSLTKIHSGVYRCEARNEYSYALSEINILVDDNAVPLKCVDSKFFINCKAIVDYKYCSNLSYLRYCCKSCLLSGQVTLEEVKKRIT